MKVSKAKLFKRFDVEFAHDEVQKLTDRFGHLRWRDMRMPRSKAKIKRKLRIVTIEEPLE